MKRHLKVLIVAPVLLLWAGTGEAQQTPPAPTSAKPPGATSSSSAQKTATPPATDKSPAAKISAPAATSNPPAGAPDTKAPATVGPSTTSTASATGTGTTYVDSGYVIGPQDVIEILVWKEPDFSRTVPVRPDGKITLPLLNDIQASGLTPVQLGVNLTKLLSKYISDPEVTVSVDRINSRLVFLSGEIGRPGAIPLLTNMTVLQAISMAGGPNQFANPKKIYVLRTENGKEIRFPFNYKNAIKGNSLKQNIFLKPGDTIVVP